MKLKVERKELEKVVKKLAPLSLKGKVLPVLLNFLIEVDKTVMKITASSAEIYGSATIKCESEDTFKFLMPTHKLSQLLANMYNDDTLTITYEEKKRRVLITYGKAKHNFGVDDTEDYPDTEELKGLETATIPNLANMVKRAVTTAETDGLKRNQNCICIDDKSVIGTDGFRCIINKRTDEGTNKNIIIPLEFAQVIAGLEGEIEMQYNENDIIVSAENYVYQSKLIDENYPKVYNVIPESSVYTLKINVLEFERAIKTAIISAEKIGALSVVLTVSKDTIKITHEDPEYGNESNIEIPYELVGDIDMTDPLELRFSSKFLLDMLAITESETIEIQGTPNKQAYKVEVDEYTYLLMGQQLHK